MRNSLFALAATGMLATDAMAQPMGLPSVEHVEVTKPLEKGGIPFGATIRYEKLDADSAKARPAEASWQVGVGVPMNRPGNCASISVSYPLVNLPGRSHANLDLGYMQAKYQKKTDIFGVYYEPISSETTTESVPGVFGGLSANYFNDISVYKGKNFDVDVDVTGALGAYYLLVDSLPASGKRYLDGGAPIEQGTPAEKFGAYMANGATATITNAKGNLAASVGAGYRVGGNSGLFLGLQATYILR